MCVDHLDASRRADQLEAGIADGAAFARLSFPWAELQPRPGALHGEAVERVLGTIDAVRAAGMACWGSLDGPLPPWFENEGGYADAGAAGRWLPRWVEAVADCCGDSLDVIVAVTRPHATAVAAGVDALSVGRALEHLVVGWRDAWRILRGATSVAVELDIAAGDEQLRWRTWLHGLTTGEVVVPGRGARSLADLAGSGDILALRAGEQLESVVHRAANDGPGLPLALAFTPSPAWSEARRAEAEARLATDSAAWADEVNLRWVLVDGAGPRTAGR